jgi:hypothetical protein
MGWFKQESIRTVRGHPAHYLRMCLKRAFQLAWFDTTNPRSFPLPYRLPYLLLLLMALVGVAASVPNPPPQWLVPVTMAAALAMVYLLVITSARFRLPLEGMMLLPAAYGTVWVTSRLGRFISMAPATVDTGQWEPSTEFQIAKPRHNERVRAQEIWRAEP